MRNALFAAVFVLVGWQTSSTAYGQDSLQELALIQRYESGESRYYPDPIVVLQDVPVEFYITTIQAEHKNKISVGPFVVTTEPVVPGKIRATLFTPEDPGEYTILNLGHGFTGKLIVAQDAQDLLQKRAARGFQEFSLLYGADGVFPRRIFVQKDVPLKLYNIGLREEHMVSFDPFLGPTQTITPNDVTEIEFVPDRVGVFPIQDQTFNLAANLVVVDGLGILGDFNSNGQLDTEDVDLLSADIRSTLNTPEFDLNADRQINSDDLRAWVEVVKDTWFGDANLDGQVDFGDFLTLSTNFASEGGWADGNFTTDTDTMVAFEDFLLLSKNFGQSTNAMAVPEPSSVSLLWMVVFGVGVLRNRR